MIAKQGLLPLRRLVFAALSAAVVLAACDTTPPKHDLPQITFAHLAPITLDVGRVEVVSNYVPPLKAPNVEHRFPILPEAAMKRWAADRLKAGGAAGTARFVITDAAVVEEPLPLSKGLAGIFKKEQAERYNGTAEASLEIIDARGLRKGFASARAFYSRTVAEDVSMNERERAWFEIVEALMLVFDSEMEQNMRQYLGGSVK